MEIKDIKDSLSIEEVLSCYGINPGKNGMINCPFHEDKTPSMQIYPKTGTAYCFSSNCKTHGHSIDVIDFIMYMDNTTKREAIVKAKELTGLNEHRENEPEREPTEILQKIFTYFVNGYKIRKENKGKEYLKARGLEVEKIENLGIQIGYNSAQFHHRGRISEAEMQACEQAGLLIKSKSGSKTETSYTPWASHCVIFPLRNPEGKITGLYGRSITDNKSEGRASKRAAKHFYLRNSKGLFYYPNKNTETLIITESIIDFLSVYQIDEIRNEYEILPIYGTNRLTAEHEEAIKNLNQLNEVILFLDGDEAGRKAAKEISERLTKQNPRIKITNVATPEGEDINSILQKSGSDKIIELLENRSVIKTSVQTVTAETPQTEQVPRTGQVTTQLPEGSSLNTNNPYNIEYRGLTADYTIKGGLKKQLDSLKVSLRITTLSEPAEVMDYRTKLDLYENKQIESVSNAASERLKLRNDLIEKDLLRLTNLLEDYREKEQSEKEERSSEPVKIKVGEADTRKCITFLKKADLIKRINKLIEQGGVVREERNRIFLLVIASSYFTNNTLHAIVQGSTSSGKTHLIKEITSFMPTEDVIKLTRVTDNSFYNYGEYQLKNKLIVIEDYDGLKEEAEYAFRELQSNDEIISSTSVKEESTGNIYAQIRKVRGPIGSIIATTKGSIYEDNMSRSFALSVDESREQDKHIIEYQNNKAAGLIDKGKEKQIKDFMQNCMRLLKPYEVVNPYASKISLPERASKIRRLNQNFQNIIKQITIINQYQRKQDRQGRLITEKSDIETACEIMFDSIILKVDELDGSLRTFYENLKNYVESKGKTYEFSRREIRHTLKISKTQQHSYINQLLELEYIRCSSGYVNRGYKYKIVYWDNAEKLRKEIKNYLFEQINNL